MSKYYVQCGPVELIISADSVEDAAFAAVDRALASHRWIYQDSGLSHRDRRTHLMIEALLHLDPTIRVSERGFNRIDALLIGAPETVDRWHRWMLAVTCLLSPE